MATVGAEGLARKKRKADHGDDIPPARQEPRRGLGVAALETIRAQLETVDNLYVLPSFLMPPPPPPPTLSLPPSFLLSGVRFNPYVGNGVVSRDFYPSQYYRPQHYALPSRYLQQLQTSNVYGVPRQQDHLAEENVVAPLLEKDHRNLPEAHGQTKKPPQVDFVDLVNSDDDDPGVQEELDLELRL